MNIDGGDTDNGEALAIHREEKKKSSSQPLKSISCENQSRFFLVSIRIEGMARVLMVYIPGNTDCAEIEVLLLFCDADPTVIVPIGECGDKLGRAAAGGL